MRCTSIHNVGVNKVFSGYESGNESKCIRKNDTHFVFYHEYIYYYGLVLLIIVMACIV